MGIDARIVVFATDQFQAEKACRAAYSRIAALEDVMSDYRPRSELMRLCEKAGQGPQKISPDLHRVLSRAQTIARQSGGGFDVTVGPLVQLWRTARKNKTLPEEAAIRDAQNRVGYENLKLGRGTAELAVPGMRLDLGGIGKGFAADEALKELRRNGIKSALIEMGGDLRLGDAPPGTKGWKISVPNASPTQTPVEMEFANVAVSSSGDTEQFVEIGGVRYSHVVDVKTGYGLTRRVQATVIASDGITSDPLSTTLTILNGDARKSFLRAYPRVKAFVRLAP